MPPKAEDPTLRAINELRSEFHKFRLEFAGWQGAKDQLCEDRGAYLRSMSGRIGKLENGRTRMLTWVLAIAGAVGGAVAVLARFVWR